MSNPNLPESELLQSVLKPLLDDFQYWFSRSCHLLENEEISFLTTQQQSELLERVKQAQQAVSSSQIMFQATGGQVGIDMAVLMPWHQLLTECWKVSTRFRIEKSRSASSLTESE
ncbi:MAG: DUF2605 domain-containing protein [Microcoleaceae cyanobacterium]